MATDAGGSLLGTLLLPFFLLVALLAAAGHDRLYRGGLGRRRLRRRRGLEDQSGARPSATRCTLIR